MAGTSQVRSRRELHNSCRACVRSRSRCVQRLGSRSRCVQRLGCGLPGLCLVAGGGGGAVVGTVPVWH